MAAKTTSGSSFLFRFVFSTLDLAQNLEKKFKGHFFKNFGSKVKKLLKWVTKTFYSRIFHILWVLCPSIGEPNLVRIRLIFQGVTACGVFWDLFFSRIFRPNYAVPCLMAYISGIKISGRWNLERLSSVRTTTDRTRDIALNDLPVGRAPLKNRNFHKLSRVWPALGEKVSGVLAPGWYMLQGSPLPNNWTKPGWPT